MSLNGGGYTFISWDMFNKLRQADFKYLFRINRDVLLRLSKPDGTQPYTVIRQYKNTGGLSLDINKFTPGNKPVNAHLGRYLYLNVLRSGIADKQTTGFISNNRFIRYRNCHYNTRGYFAFFFNQNEKRPSVYHKHNLVYERQGVAVSWRASARRPYSARRLPFNYFFFAELHFGGCGTYTSSDRWMTSRYPAHGVAIGVR